MPRPSFVDQVLAEAEVDRDRVIGAVMGLPAPIDRITGAVQDSSILPGWVGVDAAAEASRASGCRSRSRTTPTSARSPSWSGARPRDAPSSPTSRSRPGIGGGLISRGACSTASAAPPARSATRSWPRAARSAAVETAAASRRWPPRGRSPTAEPEPARGDLHPPAPGALRVGRCRGAAADRDAGRAIGVAVANLCNIAQPGVRDRRRRPQPRRATSCSSRCATVVAATRIPSAAADLEIVAGRAWRASRDAGRPGAGHARVRALRGPGLLSEAA